MVSPSLGGWAIDKSKLIASTGPSDVPGGVGGESVSEPLQPEIERRMMARPNNNVKKGFLINFVPILEVLG